MWSMILTRIREKKAKGRRRSIFGVAQSGGIPIRMTTRKTCDPRTADIWITPDNPTHATTASRSRGTAA